MPRSIACFDGVYTCIPFGYETDYFNIYIAAGVIPPCGVLNASLFMGRIEPLCQIQNGSSVAGRFRSIILYMISLSLLKEKERALYIYASCALYAKYIRIISIY